MGTRAQTYGLRLPAALACAFLLSAPPTARTQTAAQPSEISSSSVAQTVERVRAAPADSGAHARALALGQALSREGRFAEAEQLFKAVLEKQPREPAALYGAALAAFNLRRPADAEPLARAAAEVSELAAADLRANAELFNARMSGAADALVLLAVIRAVRGDDAGALRSVERAVALAPKNFDAQFALGRARYGAGDAAGAARAFREAAALRPEDERARFFLATALERSGDAAAALQTYRELVRLRPQSAEGHLGLGALLVKRGGDGLEEGIEELRRAVSINANSYEARVTLGRALLARGRAEESVEHLERAAELAPSNPEPHYQLSLAFRRLGRTAEAERESAVVKRIHEARRAAGKTDAAPVRPED